MTDWEKAQYWEKEWWDNCINTFGEELKQFEYAKRMGLTVDKKLSIDGNGKKIIDIGGGPVSMLLKVVNHNGLTVLDPIVYPSWTQERYIAAGINLRIEPAEYVDKSGELYDEAWIYNCLQHTIDPELIINSVKKICKTIRIFEWIDIPTNVGHLHTLKQGNLDKWLSRVGNVEKLNSNGCYGTSYYGVFTV